MPSPVRVVLRLAPFVIVLPGCAGGDGDLLGSLDTSVLFPLEDGRFSAYRHLSPEEAAASAPAEATLDEADLLFAQLRGDGCGGAGWRLELRAGAAWESASAVGGLHVDDSTGLAICAWEDASGSTTDFEPPIALWADAPLRDGEPLVSGAWQSTPLVEEDVTTYFGVFPRAVAFTLTGDGALDGWTLHLAEDFGLVLLETPEIAADLVYAR